MQSRIETKIGMALFAVSLLAGLSLAAPYSPWDELKNELEPVVDKNGKWEGVLVSAFATKATESGAGDVKQARSLEELTAQLTQTIHRAPWPKFVSLKVQQLAPTDKDAEGKSGDVVAIFTVNGSSKAGVTAIILLDVKTEKQKTDTKYPRVILQSAATFDAAALSNPATFEQFLIRGLDDALYKARISAGIPIENILPNATWKVPPTPCDPVVETYIFSNGVETSCVKRECQENEEGLCSGLTLSTGKKPASALPDDVVKVEQWNVISALRKAFGKNSGIVVDVDQTPTRLRGDFGATKTGGRLKRELYNSKNLPEANERLTTVLKGTLVGIERKAVLEIEVIDFARTDATSTTTPTTIVAKVNKPFPSTSNLFWFSMLGATIGCVLWRMGKTKEARASAAAMANSDSVEGNPFALLRALMEPAQALAKDIDTLSEEDIMLRSDELLTKYVLPFGEVRTKVTETLGMSMGAEILVVVAFGERMLNRVWTAASDGHAHESRACYPDVMAAFTEAHKLAGDGSASPAASTAAPSGAPTTTVR